MKQTFVKDIKALEKGEEVIDFFIAKSAAVRTGSNKREYFDILLGDKTGELNGKKWDITPEEVDSLGKIEKGDIVKVKGIITEWQGGKQMNISRIRLSKDDDELIKMDFIKTAPEDSGAMYDYIHGIAVDIEDEDFRKLTTEVLERNKERLFYYPAASKNHHSIYGGLLYHMKRMLMVAVKLCEVYEDLDKSLLFAGVIFHDMEKLNEMDSDKDGSVKEFTLSGMMLGHLVMGVVGIDALCQELNIDREKAVMLEHMVISHHYEPEFGSPKRPLFAEAEALHYLDMLDSKLYDFFDTLSQIKDGTFSEKVFTLHNRRVYKKKW